MYKIELHAHTKYSSGCSCMDEKELVSAYLEAGYAGICITDHFAPHEIAAYPAGIVPLERFLDGYRRVLDEGRRQGLTVYRGAELRFLENENDYLLLGYPDELLADAQKVFAMGVEKFYPLCKECGALLIQAHPGRSNCVRTEHRYLDGVEVLNLHPWHNSRNEETQAFAQKYPHLIQTSGSDCHHPTHAARGGILAQTLPKNEAELVALLRSRDFSLLG